MDWIEYIASVKAIGFDYDAQPKVEATACNVCGGSEFAPWMNVDRNGFGVETVVCVKCGLVFANPRMTPEAFGEFYATGTYRRLSEAYCGAAIKEGETLGDSDKERTGLIASLVEVFNGDVERLRGGVAVDVGGDSNAMGEYLRDSLDMTVTVIDPAAKIDDTSDGITIIAQTAEEWEPEEATADFIICLRSVEHLDDPSRVMRTIRKALKPDGLALISVVEFDGIWNKCHSQRQAPAPFATKIDHPYSFNRASFALLLLRNGLSPRGKAAVRAQSQYVICEPIAPVNAMIADGNVSDWLDSLGLYRYAYRNYGGSNGHSAK